MKRKVWDITVKDNPNRVVMGENDEFYTTDTEAYLVFKLDDENFNPATAVLTLENRNDGSLKNETVDVVDGLIEWEMPQRYIEHFGNWQGQLIYEDTKDGQPESYTSGQFTFVVNAHIGDKKKPSLVEIENWEKFIREGTELIETWEDLEALREENERQRVLNEQARESAESERVSNEEERELNEAERISKDSERDSKIDSKANKSMLLSPKYDLIYDSCVRDVDAPLDAYSVPMESGHYFVNVDKRESDTILTYEPDGVLLATPSTRFDFSPVLIEDFDVDFPYFDVRTKNLTGSHVVRFWFIKYKDKDNWVGFMIEGSYQEVKVITSVEGIQTEIAAENINSRSELQANPDTIYSLKVEMIHAHTNFAESTRALKVFKNEQWIFTVPIPTNSVDFPNRVGFSVGDVTEILNFKVGRSS